MKEREEVRGITTFSTKQFETRAQAEAFVAGRDFLITEMHKLADAPSDFLVRIPK